MTLRAVVVGAGWAGEGHTVALRGSGVEVIAVCGRTAGPVRAMADRMGIREARTDWRSAIAEFQPDLVSIATPARSHHDIAVAATALGCHVVCDKPLATNAVEAAAMLTAAQRAGVKHCYGATGRYSANLMHARSLLYRGEIGDLTEVEVVIHLDLPPLMPFTWIHSLADGGGLLNNMFTHSLQQVLYLTDGSVQSAAGWARPATDTVPVGPAVHDLRHWAPMTPAETAGCEWHTPDADMFAAVLASVSSASGTSVSMSWHGSAPALGRHGDSLTLYGSEGTLHLPGQPWPERIEVGKRGSDTWEEITVPSGDQGQSPRDPVQDGWDQLMRQFVDDIRGLGSPDYPTFVDGWLANEVIDIVRRQGGWTALPSEPAQG